MGFFTDFLDTLGEAIIENSENPQRLIGFADAVPIYSNKPSVLEVLLDVPEDEEDEDSE